MSDYCDLFCDFFVKVRRQDSSYQEVRLGDSWFLMLLFVFIDLYLDDEYCHFLKTNFPHYNERMVTIPVSFQYKNLKTHGIVSDDVGRKGDEKSKDYERTWIKDASGLRAEQRIFDKIQRHFSDKPCLLINGFTEHDLIKVVKSKLQQEKKGIELSEKVNIQFEK